MNIFYVTFHQTQETTYRVIAESAAAAQEFAETADFETLEDCELHTDTFDRRFVQVQQVEQIAPANV